MGTQTGSAEQGSPPGRLRRALRRMAASDSQRDAEDLQETVEDTGATPCALARDRGEVCVAGRLRSVQFMPRTNLPTLEAELWDGSGAVTLVWLGRHRIAGIEPGRTLLVRGRLSVKAGRKIIYNPFYELQPAPA